MPPPAGSSKSYSMGSRKPHNPYGEFCQKESFLEKRLEQSKEIAAAAVRQKGSINSSLRKEIIEKAKSGGVNFDNVEPESFLTLNDECAHALDKVDELGHLRDRFRFPPMPDGSDALYFCGHSLGLMPKRSKEILDEVQI